MKRPNGLGTVVKMPNGKWRAVVAADYTPQGTRRRLTAVKDTKTEAQAAMKQLLRRVAAGDTQPAGQTTVKSYADEWLPVQRRTLRPDTVLGYRTSLTKWIIPAIGRRKLTDLRPADVRAVTDAVRKAGLASTTAIYHQVVLTKMLRDALIEGHDIHASLLAMRRPPKARNDRTAMTVEQAMAVLKIAADEPDGSMWATAFLQGLRQGERLGLTWECVDLSRGEVDVSWQLQAIPYAHGCETPCGRKRPGSCPQRYLDVPDGYEFRQLYGALCLVRPKTQSGERVIPLVPWIASALRDWREIAPASPYDLVWPRPDGKPRIGPDDLAAFKEIQDRAGVSHPNGRHYVVHEIRHTTATMLMSLGVDESVRTAILGHASIEVTRGYQHASQDLARAALEGAARKLGLG